MIVSASLCAQLFLLCCSECLIAHIYRPSTQEAQVGGFWFRGIAYAMWWNIREGTKGGKTARKQEHLFPPPCSPSFIFSPVYFPLPSFLHNYDFSLLGSRSLLNLSTLVSAKERNRNLYIMVPTVLPSSLLEIFRHAISTDSTCIIV